MKTKSPKTEYSVIDYKGHKLAVRQNMLGVKCELDELYDRLDELEDEGTDKITSKAAYQEYYRIVESEIRPIQLDTARMRSTLLKEPKKVNGEVNPHIKNTEELIKANDDNIRKISEKLNKPAIVKVANMYSNKLSSIRNKFVMENLEPICRALIETGFDKIDFSAKDADYGVLSDRVSSFFFLFRKLTRQPVAEL